MKLYLVKRPRGLLVALTLFAATGFFAWFLNGFFQIQYWLFFRYAGCWLGSLVWALSCLMLGYTVLARWFGPLPKLEHLTLGLALGVLLFGLSVFFIGLLHGLNVVTFVLLPLAFIGLGFRRCARDFPRMGRRFSRIARRRFRAVDALALVFAALAIGLLYFQILWPNVFSFDVRWYHLPIAQRYALSGKVAAFEEGFWPAAFPHLASYVYAWAFLTPWTLLFDRVEFCAHIEFVLFLATLAQVPVLTRRIIPNAPPLLTLVVMLLFPGMYLYDSNLHSGADHIAGYWAIPIALCARRAWLNFNARTTILLSTFAAAAALTKYTALSIVLPASLAIFFRGVWLLARRRGRREWLGVGAQVATSLLVTAPHWLKNWLWYGDPIYPMLHKYLHVTPWNPDVSSRMKILESTGRPGELSASGVWEALKATVTFSFLPNDWAFLHRDVPVFGSLFTLTLPCLFFVRRGKRVAWLYLGGMASVFIWYLVSHYDRYLQAVVPWFAAATAACLVLAWREGLLAKLGVALLVALQLVWGADVPFFRTHNQVGDSAIRHVAAFIPTGFEKTQNLLVYEPLNSIGRALPEDATVLAHDIITILGLDRQWVTDLHQSEISYGRLKTPARIHDEFVKLGVTHLVWPPASFQRDSLAGDLAFLNYAERFALPLPPIGGIKLAQVPATRPPDGPDSYEVAVFDCGIPYATGLYKLADLTLPVVNPGPPPPPRVPLTRFGPRAYKADFLVLNKRCYPKLVPPPRFRLASTRGASQLFVLNER